MKYGDNTEKVQEVLDFACSGQILNIPAWVSDRTLIVVNDFDRAMYWARNEDIEEESDEDIPTWSDVRSEAAATIYEKRYALHGRGVEPATRRHGAVELRQGTAHAHRAPSLHRFPLADRSTAFDRPAGRCSVAGRAIRPAWAICIRGVRPVTRAA